MKLIIKCVDNVKYELPCMGDRYTSENLVEYGYNCIMENKPYAHNTYNDGVLTKTIIINSKHIISAEVEE